MRKNVKNSELSYLKDKNPKEILRQLDKLDAEERLLNFVQLSWSILEPGRPFINGWHIEAVCEHLEAISRGELIRLLINVPPGCMKSLSTSVFWPAWEWGPRNRPDTRYVGASYSQDLTVRDNRRTRNLIQSEWYQDLWGDRFELVSDQNAKVRFDTNHAGFKIATSVGGLATGERGDRFIVDDPHNIKDGESEAKRTEALLWFTETVTTRVNDPETSAIVVIMQRVHEQDVSGKILAEDFGYEHLMLPMEFEPDRKCYTSIGFEDPRLEENELLWSERFPRQVVERDKRILGSYATAGQLQQRPAPRGGGMFKRSWFTFTDKPPIGGITVRGWDLAASTKKTSPWTVGVKMTFTSDGLFYVEDVVRFRGSAHKVEERILSTAKQDGRSVRISIPQDPGQAGKAQKTYFAKLLVGYDVRFSTETGSKEVRAQAMSAQAEAENVKLMRAVWNGVYLDELTTFPVSTFKDQVDASSRAFSELISMTRSPGVAAGPEAIPLAPVA